MTTTMPELRLVSSPGPDTLTSQYRYAPAWQSYYADRLAPLVQKGLKLSAIVNGGDSVVDSGAQCICNLNVNIHVSAVRLGRRIGVLGTLATTLEPTAALIRERAAQGGGEVAVEARLTAGAFERLQAGDTRGHDERVLTELRTLLASADVVVLAQASMARVADQLEIDERRVPILTSPRLGLQRLREALGTSTRADSMTIVS